MQMSLQGVAAALAAIERVAGKAARKKITRNTCSAMGGVVKPEVVKRARAHRDTGTLDKNFVVKTKLRANGDGGYSMVGARRGVRVAITKKTGGKVLATFRKKKDGSIAVSGGKRLDKATAAGKKIRYRVPSRYLHLANKKHKFMQAAAAATKNAVLAKAEEKIKQGLKEALGR